MSIRKLILKDSNGAPVAPVTLRPGKEGGVILPTGFSVKACLWGDDLFFPKGQDLPFRAECEDFSLLGTLAGKDLFATTLSGEKAAFAKWKLACAAEREESPVTSLKTPLEADARKEPPSPDAAKEDTRSTSSPSGRDDASDRTEETPPECGEAESPSQDEDEAQAQKLARARERMEKGEPFPLFEQTMPGSRWAKIEEDGCEYLIGIAEEEAEGRVFYGIAGSVNDPPDEDRLWTFFPLDEETGYYLTEA